MSAPSDQRLERALKSALGTSVSIRGRGSVSGGCINNAERLDTSAGPYFLKWNARPLAQRFTREAWSLERMREAKSGLEIPAPIAYEDSDSEAGFLLLQYLEPGGRAPDFWVRLGRGLAQLHRSTADGFGFESPTYCGDTLQPNPWTPSWIEFYRTHRLGFQIELAAASGLLDRGARQRFEKLLTRLDHLLEEGEPSLIHGDLWSGNLHTCSKGHPALIDPAAYFGHREAELGMMRLFGGFPEAVYDAYREAWPLSPGAEARLPLYELYHVLNHANLFGGSYVQQSLQIVARFL